MTWTIELHSDKEPFDGFPMAWFFYSSNADYVLSMATGLTRDNSFGWFRHLDGMEGIAGARFIHRTIVELEFEQTKYQKHCEDLSVNYKEIIRLLEHARDSVPEDAKSKWLTR